MVTPEPITREEQRGKVKSEIQIFNLMSRRSYAGDQSQSNQCKQKGGKT